MCQQLPVGKCDVRGTCHRAEVFLPFSGIEWRTNQLAVWQFDAVVAPSFLKSAHVVFANLVAEATRTAVNLDRDIARVKTQARGGGLVVDFNDRIQLDEVVSGPQCPALLSSTFARSVRDESSIGTARSERTDQRSLASRHEAALPRVSNLPHCDRVYWKGSHDQRMLGVIERTIDSAELGRLERFDRRIG